NASIRKEALLRSYINRFPHREEELQQIYSAHRRALQESRATKPSDPFEEAYDDIIKEAVARGKTPIQVLEDRQKADANQRTLQDLQVKAALGADIAPEVKLTSIPMFFLAFTMSCLVSLMKSTKPPSKALGM